LGLGEREHRWLEGEELCRPSYVQKEFLADGIRNAFDGNEITKFCYRQGVSAGRLHNQL